MDTSTLTSPKRRKFAVIFVLGAPGSGKGTICSFLACKYSLLHFSVGDNLRTWMQANGGTPLAARIRDKLDHQGFLTSAELNPILGLAIEDAIQQDGLKGILIDGFPRCQEQLDSWANWPFQERLRLEGSTKPDVVLSLNVTRENAKTRYLSRARDHNDSAVKFERRYSEYLEDGQPIEQHYQEAALLIQIDNNGPKEDSLDKVEKALGESSLWDGVVARQETESSFIL
ncbi:adenylate kinase 1 ATP binding protein [Diaporthe sp. PMI_573]|nr:adenylate kinase 1 ATP binding protein [Diaporthaceae sp. PMI_573]